MPSKPSPSNHESSPAASAGGLKLLTGAIEEQLQRILVSAEFQATDKMRDFLKFVVEETLAGRADELKGYTIATMVYGRKENFDASQDPMVRIQAGKLRRALERYYLVAGSNDPVHIDIPKGTYVPSFAHHPPEQDAQAKESIAVEARASSSAMQALGVFPFNNFTGDSGKDYFVQGFTEELIIELARYDNLRVIGCSHPPGINAESNDNRRFARELGVRFCVEGSVRMDERHVKVSVRLTDSSTGEHLWGEHYREELSAANLITIQEEIAQRTATYIGAEYGIIHQELAKESSRKRPSELNTYDTMLRFYRYQTLITPESFLEAFSALQKAVVDEPNYGITMAMLGSMYGTMYMLDLPSDEDVLEKLVQFVNKAVELDPDNQFVRIVYAWMYFVLEDQDLFFSEMEKALALNPNSPFRVGAIGFYLCLYGEWERGKALLDEAMNRNLSFPTWYHGVTTVYFYRTKHYTKAYEEALKYENPSLFWSPLLRAATLGQLGRYPEAQHHLVHLKSLRPDFEDKARELIARYVKEKELVDHILEGLRKAGLAVGVGES